MENAGIENDGPNTWAEKDRTGRKAVGLEAIHSYIGGNQMWTLLQK